VAESQGLYGKHGKERIVTFDLPKKDYDKLKDFPQMHKSSLPVG
jgi:hypothetical protein